MSKPIVHTLRNWELEYQALGLLPLVPDFCL